MPKKNNKSKEKQSKGKQSKEKQSKGKQYKEKQCSPFKKGKLKDSCLSRESLIIIAMAIIKDKGIEIDYKHLDNIQLYSKLETIFRDVYKCKTEACWIHNKSIKENMSSKDFETLKDYFRPPMPKELVKDFTEWLSNFDIEDVLYKHHRNLNNFYFYGAVPIDFKKCSVSNDLCKIDILEHKKRSESKLGIVFNTDESNKPGKHWMAMYVDLDGVNIKDNPGIYFFDSFGSSPSSEIKELIKKIKQQGSKSGIKFVVAHNDKSYQHNTYACGFYSMHFIENMLRGNSFDEYLNSGLNDKKMRRYLNKCFLHPLEIKC